MIHFIAGKQFKRMAIASALLIVSIIGSELLPISASAGAAPAVASASVGHLAKISAHVAHTFHYQSPANAPAPSRVNLAGDFNNWSPTAAPMAPASVGSPGEWSVTVRLSPGLHHYKFVLNGNQWIADPAADPLLSQNDGNGGQNSGIRIRSAWQRMASPVANVVPIHAIAFSTHSIDQCDVVTPNTLRLTLTAQTGSLTHAAALVATAANSWKALRMDPEFAAKGAATWEVIAHLTQPVARFCFALTHGHQTLFLANRNFYTTAVAAQAHAYVIPMRPSVVTPDWATRAVWYEIFPERFANGSKANDPAHHIPWRWSWFKPYKPAGEKGNFYTYVYNRFYGGDIQGISQKLGYLRKLGVTALYLTPVFESPSIHKYDPWDFRHVDDGFGVKNSISTLKGEKIRNPKTWQWSASDKVFLHFIRQAHKQGFKVIIDVPFGHCGVGFAPFQSVLKLGKKSPYANWFNIIKWGPPVVYQGWGQVGGNMPMFRHYPGTGLAPGYCRYLFAITRRWMAPNGKVADGIDGWRLDTAPDVPHSFWIAWRKVVKKINPKAVIIGEIWTPSQAWLNAGNQFDAVMNYPLATLCTQFFAANRRTGGIGIGPKRFGAGLADMLNWYPWQVDLTQQNLIDSHDTDRFVSRLVNMNLPFNADDRLQNGDHYSSAKPTAEDYSRFKQVVAFQMAFPGAPMVWYGDEVGMWGATDPSDRQPMLWKNLMPYNDPQLTINTSLLHFYRRAIAARRQLPPLETGSYGQLLALGRRDVFAFYRSIRHQHVYVVLNRSSRSRTVNLPLFAADRNHHLFNYLSQKDFYLKLPPEKKGSPASRPVLILRRAAIWKISSGTALKLTLAPWQTMILARKSVLAARGVRPAANATK